MKGFSMAVASLCLAVVPVFATNTQPHFDVHPAVYDPAHTDLVQSVWLAGTGCPTNAGVSTTGGNKPDSTYTDTACPTGDTKDNSNDGLLLVKTGPTANYAAALANITGLPNNTVLSEIGYDIRKPGTPGTEPSTEPGGAYDHRGSHCGAGAPRFDITTANGNSYFVGCASPPAVVMSSSQGWIRLRWGTGSSGSVKGYNAATGNLESITSPVTNVQIVFDEGQDTGPDNFGAAILDNIDINGSLVGQGGGGPSN
jgi:hypothetical protein